MSELISGNSPYTILMQVNGKRNRISATRAKFAKTVQQISAKSTIFYKLRLKLVVKYKNPKIVKANFLQ